MARISDTEGSRFDAPLDVVWKYLQDPTGHGGAHTGSRNRTTKPLTENSFIVSWKQNMGGNWMKIEHKITVFVPLAMAAEMIEGPMKGSRTFTVYTPRGSKTEVEVHWGVQSSTVPPDQLEGMVRTAWDSAFNEDNVGIRTYAGRHN